MLLPLAVQTRDLLKGRKFEPIQMIRYRGEVHAVPSGGVTVGDAGEKVWTANKTFEEGRVIWKCLNS